MLNTMQKTALLYVAQIKKHFFLTYPLSGVQKKGTFSHFQHNQDYLEQKSFYSRKYRQSAISEPILVTFGGCQNCQNQTFNWPYQLYKSKYEKYFFVKRNTMMLFCMYQVFSSLLGHLHFFVHFSFTFMEHLFFGHPIQLLLFLLLSSLFPLLMLLLLLSFVVVVVLLLVVVVVVTVFVQVVSFLLLLF